MNIKKSQLREIIREQVELEILKKLEEGFKWDWFKGSVGAAGQKVKDIYNQIKDAGRRKAVERMGQKFAEEVGKLYGQMTEEMTKYQFRPEERKAANAAIAQTLIDMGSKLKYVYSRSPALKKATPAPAKAVTSPTAAPVPAGAPAVTEMITGKWTCANCNFDGSGEATVCPRCGQPNLRSTGTLQEMTTEKWTCLSCNYHGTGKVLKCEQCGQQNLRNDS